MSSRLDEQAVNRLLQASDALLSEASSPANSRSTSLMDLPTAVAAANAASSSTVAPSADDAAAIEQASAAQDAESKAQADRSEHFFSLVMETDQALTRAKTANYVSAASFSGTSQLKARSPSLERQLFANATGVANAAVSSPLSSTGASLRDPASSRGSSRSNSIQAEGESLLGPVEPLRDDHDSFDKDDSQNNPGNLQGTTLTPSTRLTFTPPPREMFGGVSDMASDSSQPGTPPRLTMLQMETAETGVVMPGANPPTAAAVETPLSTSLDVDPDLIPSEPSTPSVTVDGDDFGDQTVLVLPPGALPATAVGNSSALAHEPTHLLSESSSASEPEPPPPPRRRFSSTDEAWDLGEDFDDPFSSPLDDADPGQRPPASPQRSVPNVFKLGLHTLTESSSTDDPLPAATPFQAQSTPKTEPPAYRSSLAGITVTESPTLPRAAVARPVRSTTITGSRLPQVRDIFSRTRQLATGGTAPGSPSTPQPGKGALGRVPVELGVGSIQTVWRVRLGSSMREVMALPHSAKPFGS